MICSSLTPFYMWYIVVAFMTYINIYLCICYHTPYPVLLICFLILFIFTSHLHALYLDHMILVYLLHSYCIHWTCYLCMYVPNTQFIFTWHTIYIHMTLSCTNHTTDFHIPACLDLSCIYFCTFSVIYIYFTFLPITLTIPPFTPFLSFFMSLINTTLTHNTCHPITP